MKKFDLQQEVCDGELVTIIPELEEPIIETIIESFGRPFTLNVEYMTPEQQARVEQYKIEQYEQALVDQMRVGRKVRMRAPSGDMLVGEVVEFDRETMTATVGKLEWVTPKG